MIRNWYSAQHTLHKRSGGETVYTYPALRNFAHTILILDSDRFTEVSICGYDGESLRIKAYRIDDEYTIRLKSPLYEQLRQRTLIWKDRSDEPKEIVQYERIKEIENAVFNIWRELNNACQKAERAAVHYLHYEQGRRPPQALIDEINREAFYRHCRYKMSINFIGSDHDLSNVKGLSRTQFPYYGILDRARLVDYFVVWPPSKSYNNYKGSSYEKIHLQDVLDFLSSSKDARIELVWTLKVGNNKNMFDKEVYRLLIDLSDFQFLREVARNRILNA